MGLKATAGTPLWQRIGDRVVERLESRVPVCVNKKKYCLTALFLGWMGGHQFLVGRKAAGVLYLLTCVTGLSVILTALDLLRYVFLPADEQGNIYVK